MGGESVPLKPQCACGCDVFNKLDRQPGHPTKIGCANCGAWMEWEGPVEVVVDTSHRTLRIIADKLVKANQVVQDAHDNPDAAVLTHAMLHRDKLFKELEAFLR